MDTKRVSELAERHRVEFERRADAREEEAAKKRRAQRNMEQMVTEPWNALGEEL